MKSKKLLLGGLFLLSAAAGAQETKALSLDEAIALAVTKSTEATLADTRVATAGYDLDNVKKNVYPDFKIAGQYMRLTNASVNLRLPVAGSGDTGTEDPAEGETANSSPKIRQLVLGQANLTMPLFSGYRLKYNVEASEDLQKAATYNAAHTKELLAMQAVVLYTNLYKAMESVTLIQENLKSANQRVTDFTAMEENGLLARNDFLKAQLQSSNIQLSLDEARKNVATINYQLVTLLKLPEGTMITPGEAYFKNSGGDMPAVTADEAVGNRSDLEALRWQQKASEANVGIAKSAYYPTVAFTGGYIAFDLQNVLEVHNAVNVGIGLSYNISDIFKNSKRVKAASSAAEETKQSVSLLADRVKVEVQNALENYNLSVKQNRVYTEAMVQAAENYRIVNDKYENGLVDTNDLLEADIQQLQAKINEAFSKADITQRYYELLNASGRLTGSFNLTPNKK